LTAYLDEWLVGIPPTLAVAARTNYRSLITLYVRPGISQLQPGTLTGSTLTNLYAQLLASGGKNGKPLSSTTVRLVHSPGPERLNQVLHLRIEESILTRNRVHLVQHQVE